MIPGFTPSPSLYTAALPTRKAGSRVLHFASHPSFRPNLTPSEMFRAGACGGGYFRRIRSGVTGLSYVDAWKEFPAEWWEGLNPAKHLASSTYNPAVNKWGVMSGQGLEEWESSGWIKAQDPFGCVGREQGLRGGGVVGRLCC